MAKLEAILAENSADPLVEREVGCFQTHRDHLGDAKVAARNAPVGSGSMESVCGQFPDRLKRHGQFWPPQGLANMLKMDVTAKNNALQYLWN